MYVLSNRPTSQNPIFSLRPQRPGAADKQTFFIAAAPGGPKQSSAQLSTVPSSGIS